MKQSGTKGAAISVARPGKIAVSVTMSDTDSESELDFLLSPLWESVQSRSTESERLSQGSTGGFCCLTEGKLEAVGES